MFLVLLLLGSGCMLIACLCFLAFPLELENDGDLIGLVREMILRRGQGTVCITKVKGHAGESMVRQGQVGEKA